MAGAAFGKATRDTLAELADQIDTGEPDGPTGEQVEALREVVGRWVEVSPAIVPVDLTVLRLERGDVLVAQVDVPDPFTEGDEDAPPFNFGDALSEALVAALAKAGHDHVGVIITNQCRVDLTIVRPEGEPDGEG